MLVQQLKDGVEVVAVASGVSMQAVENKALEEVAIEISNRLRSVMDSL
jgi:hypothetical protein